MGEITAKLPEGSGSVIRGWTLVVNTDSVAAVLSPGHFTHLSTPDLEREIDGLTEAINRSLRKVLSRDPV